MSHDIICTMNHNITFTNDPCYHLHQPTLISFARPTKRQPMFIINNLIYLSDYAVVGCVWLGQGLCVSHLRLCDILWFCLRNGSKCQTSVAGLFGIVLCVRVYHSHLRQIKHNTLHSILINTQCFEAWPKSNVLVQIYCLLLVFYWSPAMWPSGVLHMFYR